jgi:hypothetical protein
MTQAQVLTYALWRLRHPEFGTAELALSITQEPFGTTLAALMVDGEPLRDRQTGNNILKGRPGSGTAAQFRNGRPANPTACTRMAGPRGGPI